MTDFNKFRFEGLDARCYSNKYMTMKRVSDDESKIVVKVADEQVFETQYGFGLIINRTHVVWLKSWQVSVNWYGTEILLNKDYFKPTESKREFENYLYDPENESWETWLNVAKDQAAAENMVHWC